MTAGKKTIKVATLVTLLSIPGVNVVVGTAMVAQLIYSTTELASGCLDKIQITTPKVQLHRNGEIEI